MKTLIISGGTITASFATAYIQNLQPDFIIGVDHGLEFCARNHIRPHQILGDFDSIDPAVLAQYQQTDIPIRRYNPVKDATDTCIALELAIAQNSTEIHILGGTGTRLDHFLCNLQTLKKAYLAKIPTYLIDAHNRITLPVSHHFTLKKVAQFGKYVSFFPLDADITELTLKGFQYPLNRHPLRGIDGLGVSNQITDEFAEVTYCGGILVMIESRD